MDNIFPNLMLVNNDVYIAENNNVKTMDNAFPNLATVGDTVTIKLMAALETMNNAFTTLTRAGSLVLHDVDNLQTLGNAFQDLEELNETTLVNGYVGTFSLIIDTNDMSNFGGTALRQLRRVHGKIYFGGKMSQATANYGNFQQTHQYPGIECHGGVVIDGPNCCQTDKAAVVTFNNCTSGGNCPTWLLSKPLCS